MTDYSKLFADHDADMAGTNAAATSGIAPQAAVDAHRAAALSGIPPSVGMLGPQESTALADQRRNAATLAASPHVQSFVASDPAKAAAVGDDYAPLAKVGALAEVDMSLSDWLARGGPVGDIASAFHESHLAFDRAGTRLTTAQTTGDIPGQLMSQATGVFDAAQAAFSPLAAIATPLARLANKIPSSTYSKVLEARGQLQGREQTPEEKAQASLALGSILTGFIPLPSLGRLRLPVRGGTVDEGLIRANPPRLTGPVEHVADAEFVDIPPPGLHPAGDVIHGAQAEVDAAHAAEMQGALTETATHGRSLTLTEDYLRNHTAVGERTVGVPAENIAGLWAQGHEVFPQLAGEVREALQTGGEVKVPLSTYLTETAGKPFAEELNAASRFREGGVSVEEGKALAGGEEAAPPTVREPTPPEDVTLTPEVRAYAANADSAVAQVFKESTLDKLFEFPKAAGMTSRQMQGYSARVEEAQAALHERLMERAYAQVRRERTPDWKAAVELHTEAARALIESQPNVTAYRALRDPLFKLDTELVRQLHPDLPLPATLTKRGGLSPDEAAELTGHASGAELVADLHHLSNAIEAGGGDIASYVRNRAKVYAEEQARADALDATPEGILAAARELVVAPEVEDLLTDQLREFADANGLPFSKADVEALAAEHFGELTTAEAARPKTFAENMRRLGNKAETALLDGKDIDAFRYKQQQLIQFLQMKESFKFAKELAKATKAMNTVARKPINRGMDQAARNHLRAIAAQLGFPVRSGKFENFESALKGQTLEEYGRSLTARGQPVYITDVPSGPVSALSVNTFRDVNDMFTSIAALGREEMKLTSEGAKRAMAEVVEDIRTTATEKVGRRFTAGEVRQRRGLRAIADKPGAMMRALGAANTRNETALYWLDGEKFGPLMRYIVTPLNNSAAWKIQRVQEVGRALKEFTASQPKGWDKSLEAAVNVPELTFSRTVDGQPVPWMRDRGDLVVAALHMGTEENWAKLTEGFGWDPATVEAALFRELTPADWRYVQFMWDQAQKLWPETQALYRETVGLAPKEVVGRNFTTPDGTTMRGRYWHLRYDWNAVGENATPEGEEIAVTDPMSLGASELFGDHFQVSTPPNGSVKQRTQYRGPLDLSHGALYKDFEAVIHDLAFRRELIQAAKLLRQAGVRSAIREALGPEWVPATEQWLKDIAQSSNYDRTVLSGLAGFLRAGRRRFTIVQVGFNFATVIKHGGIAAAHMLREGGPQLPGAIRDLLWNGGHWTKFIDANSAEVPNTLFNLDRDIREAMEESFRRQGQITKMQYYSTVSFAIVKRAEAQATWLAKYRSLVAEGMGDPEAFALADKSVRDTQGSGTTVNLAALQRGESGLAGEALKWLNVFTSFMNTATNRMWTMARRTERMTRPARKALGGRPIAGYVDEGWAGARRDFIKNIGDLHAYILIPALWTTLVDVVPKALLAGVAADVILEEFKQHFGEHAAEGALGGSVPLGTTIAQIPKMWREKKFDPGGDAFSEVMTSIASTAFNTVEALKGEQVHDNKWPTHAMETAGYLTGLPTKPVARAGQFWWDRERGAVTNSGPVGAATAVLLGNAAVRQPQGSSGTRSTFK